MSISSGPPMLLMLLAAIALLAGLWLVRRGWRGVRVGAAPFCAACGYSLVGATSDRCPECGADVSRPGGVARGVRVRRTSMVTAGAALAVVGAVLLTGGGAPAVRNFDWYTVRPLNWVLDDLASPSSPNRARALQEIDRRERDGTTLTQAQRDRLAEIALAEQALPVVPNTSVPQDLVNWLGREAFAGRLTDKQKQRFFEQALRLTLTLRPKVIDGNAAPYRVSTESRSPNGNSYASVWTRVEDVSASVDGGKPVPLGGSGTSSGFGGGGSSSSSIEVKGLGRHELTFVARVGVWTGPDFADTGSPRNALQHARDVTLTGTFEVVPDLPDHRVRRVADPAMEAGLRASITPSKFEFVGTNPRELAGELDVKNPPVGVAFGVFARVGGKEYPLSTVTLTAGSRTRYGVRSYRYDGPTDVPAFDLVLRTDESAARRTVDLFQIWDGEIVVKDVPATQGK